jgi:glutaredoxin
MFKLYVLEGCPFCTRALNKLSELKLKFHAIPVNPNEKEKYKKAHGMDSFPQVFFIDKTKNYKIGGCDELIELTNLITKVKNYNTNMFSKILYELK